MATLDYSVSPLIVTTELAIVKKLEFETLSTSTTFTYSHPVLIGNVTLYTDTYLYFTTTPFIYTVDSDNNEIKVFDYDGNFLFSFGSYGDGDGEFNSPFGVTSDGEFVYVTDVGNNRIEIFDLYGNYISEQKLDWVELAGIASDATFIYVVDKGAKTVYIYTKDFYPIGTITNPENCDPCFEEPQDIFSEGDFIYVYDVGNQLFFKFEKPRLPALASLILLPEFDSYSTGTLIYNTVKINLPSIEVESSTILGIISEANINLPSLNLHAFSGNVGYLILPEIIIQSTSSIQHIIANINLAYLNLNSFVNTNYTISSVSFLPYLQIRASPIFGDLLASSIDLSPLQVKSISRQNFNNVVIPISLYSLSLISVSTLHTVGDIWIHLPTLNIHGYTSLFSHLHNEAFIFNPYNLAVSKYTNLNFNSVAQLNDKIFFSSPDGLYMLDENQIEQATFSVGIRDIYENKQAGFTAYIRPIEFFLVGYHEGLALTYSVPEENYTLNYQINSYNKYETRVKLPRGTKGRLIGLTFSNFTAKDFTLKSVKLVGYKISRRIR